MLGVLKLNAVFQQAWPWESLSCFLPVSLGL